MTKQVQKATKIVNKATSTFSKAVQQVEAANELLRKEVDINMTDIHKAHEEIKKWETFIHDTYFEVDKKEALVQENKKLIEKLTEFVPQV
jgi:hypothetical protein